MHNTNAYVATEEREEIPNEGKAAQQLEQILASGLPPLYRRAYRILGNASDAEDAVQDALLAAYTHLYQFRGQAQISTWLTTIVLSCARLQLRRRPRHAHVSLDESTGELQPVSVSEVLADHRPSPEDEYRGSELSTRLTHLHCQLEILKLKKLKRSKLSRVWAKGSRGKHSPHTHEKADVNCS
jgi:RNA polymerase sigma factor (sigma-70 family)